VDRKRAERARSEPKASGAGHDERAERAERSGAQPGVSVRPRPPAAVAARLVASLLILLLAALGFRNIVDTDFGLHLASGRWIAEHGGVPGTDPFTYTVPDHEYLAYHWAFQLAVHWIWEHLGARGLVWSRLGVVLVSGLLVADVLRRRRCSAPAVALVGLGAILALEHRLFLRPELMTYLCLAITLWVLERHRAGPGAPLWLLPLVQWVWVNTHVFAIGWGLIAAYLADEALRTRRLRTPLAFWSAASALALLANPYHVRAVVYPFLLATRLGASNPFGQEIAELVSPLALVPDPRLPFSVGPQMNAWRALALLGALAVGIHARRRRIADACVVAVYGALSLLAVRNVGIYALAAAPALAVALDDAGAWLRSRAANPRWLRSAAPALLVAASAYAALTTVRVASGSFYAAGRRAVRPAAELCSDCLALDAADWVAGRRFLGRGFNNLNVGSTLIWRDPEHPVFIDARNEVTGERFFAEYLAISRDPVRWRAAAARFGFEYVVLAHELDAHARALGLALERDPAWRLVYVDGAALVFVRRDGPNGGTPPAVLPSPIDAGERRLRLASLHVEPGALARARRWLLSREPAPGSRHELGTVLVTLGRTAEAERPLLDAAEESPGFWEVHNNLGVLYRRLGLAREALVAYQNALALNPGEPTLRARVEELTQSTR
jgi:tetratricopeptide (TPR) repeat protein